MTLLYDEGTEPIIDPVAVAMASAFMPFPSMTGSDQLPRRRVEYGTGIVVSRAGHILTDRRLTDACGVIVIGGHGDAERLAEDADLAVIRLHGARDLMPAALANDGAKGPELTLVGIADPQSQDGGSAITSVAGRLKGELVEPTPQPGFSGAAVLDGQGRFFGMAELKTR